MRAELPENAKATNCFRTSVLVMLVIIFHDKPSTESEEIAPGIVVDFDADGNIVGMELEDASKRVDLSK